MTIHTFPYQSKTALIVEASRASILVQKTEDPHKVSVQYENAFNSLVQVEAGSNLAHTWIAATQVEGSRSHIAINLHIPFDIHLDIKLTGGSKLISFVALNSIELILCDTAAATIRATQINAKLFGHSKLNYLAQSKTVDIRAYDQSEVDIASPYQESMFCLLRSHTAAIRHHPIQQQVQV